MADDIKAKLDKQNAEAFKKTVAQFHESVLLTELASQEIDKGGVALQEFKDVWKDEVSKPMKDMVSGFTSIIPGFGLASKISLLVWKNTLGENFRKKRREKKEEKLLRDRLGLSKTQMKEAREAAQQIKAEEALLKNLTDVSESWGLLADFDLGAELKKKEELHSLDRRQFAAEAGDERAALSPKEVERMKQLQEEQKNLNATELNIIAQQEKVISLKDEQEAKARDSDEKR